MGRARDAVRRTAADERGPTNTPLRAIDALNPNPSTTFDRFRLQSLSGIKLHDHRCLQVYAQLLSGLERVSQEVRLVLQSLVQQPPPGVFARPHEGDLELVPVIWLLRLSTLAKGVSIMEQ